MNKILPTAIATIALFFAALTFPVTNAYAAPSLLYDKTAVTVAQNTTFTVGININVDTYTAQSSKVTVKYATADLDVVQVSNGQFFPSFAQANDTSNGLLEITGYTTSAGSGSTANGKLATITFKGKKSTGSSTMSISCTTGNHDSNILTVAGSNILDCSQINTVSVAYGASTVTTTTTPGTTLTPTPGGTNTLPVCASLTSDKTSGVGTPLAVTFTCAGVDTDGYINAAYFDFGDGTNQTIEKNVGSPGTISTTHTYTTIGSLGVSCKVRDNNAVWTSVPDVCKKIITIQPKQTTRRVIVLPTPTKGPTPTPQTFTLVYVTPTATPSPELTPFPTEEPAEEPSSPMTGWLIGSIVVIGIGGVIYLLSKRSHKPPTHIPPPVAPPSPPPPITQ